MIKLVLNLVGAAAIAAPALAATPISFERDGTAYVGSLTEHDGIQHIVGHEVGSHRMFELYVRNGHVDGMYDGERVSYALPSSSNTVLTASR